MSNGFAELARDYQDTVRERYNEYRSHAKEGQMAVMRYYTFAGDEIRVGTVSRRQGSGTILIEGEIIGTDGEKIPCDVVIQPPGAQLVLKLITSREAPPEPEVEFPTR